MHLAPMVALAVTDMQGNMIRLVEAQHTAGFHRVAWDLRYPSTSAVGLGEDNPSAPGMMAAPGTYMVTLMARTEGSWTPLAESKSFVVKPLREGALEGAPHDQVAAFWRRFERATRDVTALNMELGQAMQRATSLATALARTPGATTELAGMVSGLTTALKELEMAINGSPAKREVGENTDPNIGSRLFAVQRGIERSTYGPTTTHREQLAIVEHDVQAMGQRLVGAQQRLNRLALQIVNMGGPWVEGTTLLRN